MTASGHSPCLPFTVAKRAGHGKRGRRPWRVQALASVFLLYGLIPGRLLSAPPFSLQENLHEEGGYHVVFYDQTPDANVMTEYAGTFEAWIGAGNSWQIVSVQSGPNGELVLFQADEKPQLWILHQGYGYYMTRADTRSLDEYRFHSVFPYRPLFLLQEAMNRAPGNLKRTSLPGGGSRIEFPTNADIPRIHELEVDSAGRVLLLEEKYGLPRFDHRDFFTHGRRIEFADFDARNPLAARKIVTRIFSPHPILLYPDPIPWITVERVVKESRPLRSDEHPDTILSSFLARGYSPAPEGICYPPARETRIQNNEETTPLWQKEVWNEGGPPPPAGLEVKPYRKTQFQLRQEAERRKKDTSLWRRFFTGRQGAWTLAAIGAAGGVFLLFRQRLRAKAGENGR